MILDSKKLNKIPKKHRKLKVITAIGMFYDLNPSKFIKDAESLDKDGIFVQLMCSHSMFKMNDLEIFVKHLEYYSYDSQSIYSKKMV